MTIVAIEWINGHFLTFAAMASIRQEKVSGIIQKELSMIFQRESTGLCLGSMVTVTVVRISPDLGVARCYLSIFAGPDPKEVFANLDRNKALIRHELSQITKNQLRRVPELMFFIDDSLDYAEEIDRLLD